MDNGEDIEGIGVFIEYTRMTPIPNKTPDKTGANKKDASPALSLGNLTNEYDIELHRNAHVTLYIIIYMSGPSTATVRETEQRSMRDGKESDRYPDYVRVFLYTYFLSWHKLLKCALMLFPQRFFSVEPHFRTTSLLSNIA